MVWNNKTCVHILEIYMGLEQVNNSLKEAKVHLKKKSRSSRRWGLLVKNYPTADRCESSSWLAEAPRAVGAAAGRSLLQQLAARIKGESAGH